MGKILSAFRPERVRVGTDGGVGPKCAGTGNATQVFRAGGRQGQGDQRRASRHDAGQFCAAAAGQVHGTWPIDCQTRAFATSPRQPNDPMAFLSNISNMLTAFRCTLAPSTC